MVFDQPVFNQIVRQGTNNAVRLLRNLFLGVLLLLLVLAGAGVLWREAVLETAGNYGLETLGFDQAGLTITQVSMDRMIAENVSLGLGLPTLRRVELYFEPQQLIRGELRRLEISGLRVIVEKNGENLNKLKELIGGNSDSGSEENPRPAGSKRRALPHILLEDAEVTLRATPAGDGLLRLSGEVLPGPDGLAARMQAGLDLGHTDATLTARTETIDGQNIIYLTGDGTTDATDLLAQGPFAEQAAAIVAKGKARYNLEGRIPAPLRHPADSKAWLSQVFGLNGTISVSELQTAYASETVSGEVIWRIAGDGQVLRLTLPQASDLTVSAIPPARLAALGLDMPPDEPFTVRIESSSVTADLGESAVVGAWMAKSTLNARMHGAEFDVSIDADSDAGSPDIALRQIGIEAKSVPLSKGGVTGRLESFKAEVKGSFNRDKKLELNGKISGVGLMLAHPQATLDRLTVETPVTLSGSFDQPQVRADGLSAVAEGLTVPGRASVTQPLAIAASVLRWDGQKAVAEIRVDKGAASVVAGSGKPVSAAWEQVLASISASMDSGGKPQIDGSINVSNGSASIPSAGVRISGMELALPLQAGPLTFSGQIRDGQRNPRFTPVAVKLSGKKAADAVTLSGSAAMHRGRAWVPLRIKADFDTQKVRAYYGPAKLTFAEDKLQPKNLSPSLSKINQATGIATVSGLVAIDPGRAPRLSAAVVFDEVSLKTDGVAAEGLNGKLKLSSLQPLASSGEQTLTLRRLVAGVPLDDVFARFTIPRRSGGLTVELGEVGTSLAGGTIRVRDATYQNGAADLLVRVSALPLERLLREWQVEGLDGTGLISGTIPVAIRAKGVGIGGGRLDGQQPGVIRVDFGSARNTLTSAGSQVELAVRTLEDFHYRELSIGVSKPMDGELSLAIGLDGNNPAVLEGHPFRFNINLSGRLEPILEAIQAGDRISADLLRGSLGR